MPSTTFLEFIKITILPALFALALYYTTTTYILPYYRAHKSQYAQYIPLPRTGALSPDSLAATSHSLRERISAGLIAFVLPRRPGFENGSSANGVGMDRTYGLGSRSGSDSDLDLELELDDEDVMEDQLEAGRGGGGDSRRLVGFEGIGELNAGRRAEMVREIESMEGAARSVRRGEAI